MTCRAEARPGTAPASSNCMIRRPLSSFRSKAAVLRCWAGQATRLMGLTHRLMGRTHRSSDDPLPAGAKLAHPVSAEPEWLAYLQEMCELLWPPPAVVTVERNQHG